MKDHLYILWTNADILTAKHMVMMYGTNGPAKDWWKEVTIIIWGATAKLVAENEEIQERMKIAEAAGVHFSACITCAKELGVEEDLKALGIELIKWGEPLTNIIKEKKPLLTI